MRDIRSAGDHPLSTNPTPPQIRPPTEGVVIDDSGAQPTYSNFCRVIATAEEALFDFALNPQLVTTSARTITSDLRIVTTFYTAKRLMVALAATIQHYEQSFGTIEVDIGRRVEPKHPFEQ